jgi:hypothetical protein
VFSRLFPRLAAKWAAWKAGNELEYQEIMEASRQARELVPDVEVARVVSPDGIRDALVLQNEARRVFVSVVSHAGGVREAKTAVVFQHCLDLDGVRVTWVDEERLRIENQCNEYSVVDTTEIDSHDDSSITILVR